MLFLVMAMVAAACGADDPVASPPTDPSPADSSPADSTPVDSTPVDSTPDGPDDDGAIVPVAVPDREVSSDTPDIAGAAVAAFGWDIYLATAEQIDPDANAIVSPLSIATALGMLEPGANGDALEQLHAILRIDDPERWHASMSALEQSLEGRVAELPGGGAGEEQDPGEFDANIANGAFIQPGYPFRTEYLAAIGINYGAVIEELDFRADQEAAAERINTFIADATDDRITDLLSADDIDPATVLALVNALVLQASWQTRFDESVTTDHDFTLPDGSAVGIPLMDGRSDRSGRGDGWVAATKQLVGAVSFEAVLPDDGRFDEIAARIDEVFDEFDRSTNPAGRFAVPRFETRVNVALTEALQVMGLTAPFAPGNLLGIADDPETVLDKALHETWLSVDESGIEAAAATVLLVMATSAPAEPPVDVVLDRPFLFRLVDDATGATLFVGRVMDPTG